MTDLRYSKDHEYVALDGDLATLGISDYAQSQLGDIVFIELPEVGKKVAKGKEIAVIESVKAASEVYSPVSGEVVEVNPRAWRSAGARQRRSAWTRVAHQGESQRPGRMRIADGRRRLFELPEDDLEQVR